MAAINGYNLESALKADNSGFSKWGFAIYEGERYFIKEFISPVYPIKRELLIDEQFRNKKEICKKYEERMKERYNLLNQHSDGNLVRIEHFFRYESKYYITTKAYPTCSLQKLQELPFEKRIHLCRVLAHSLSGMHEAGLVHGDIKMDNILFPKLTTGYHTAKIIDFDACFPEASPPKSEDEIHGDMVYMAPETFLVLIEEEAKLTRAIDVFAMGIVFHQILSGSLPGYDKKRFDYPFEAILEGETLQCSNCISGNMRAIIERMLVRDPEARISMSEVFREISGDVPTHGKPSDGFFKPLGDL